MTETEIKAWQAFRGVVKFFLGKNRDPNYKEIVKALITTVAGKLPQQGLEVAGHLKKAQSKVLGSTRMQRRTNKLWEQSTKALSGQQRNKKVSRVQLPQVKPMKQLHKNAGLPYIERKETGRACDLKHMT